jgi:hypothetical protein
MKPTTASFTETFEIGWAAFVPNQAGKEEAHLRAVDPRRLSAQRLWRAGWHPSAPALYE